MARFVGGGPMRKTQFTGQLGVSRRRQRRAAAKAGEAPREKPLLAREWPELLEAPRRLQNEGRGRE
jgi:hypothetical protein